MDAREPLNGCIRSAKLDLIMSFGQMERGNERDVAFWGPFRARDKTAELANSSSLTHEPRTQTEAEAEAEADIETRRHTHRQTDAQSEN